MSKNRPSQAGSSSLAERWKQVVLFGQELVARSGDACLLLENIDWRSLVVPSVSEIIRAQVELWISDEYLPEIIGQDETTPHEFAAPTGWLQRAYHDERTYMACEGETDEWLEACDAPEVVALPLKGDEGRVIGAIQAVRAKGDPFTADDCEFFESLAGQVSLALSTAARVAREHWRVEQLSLVRQVSLQIGDLRDLDELSRQVTRLILYTFDYYYVSIFTVEPGQEYLYFRASYGPEKRLKQAGKQEPGASNTMPSDQPLETTASPVLRIRVGEGMIGQSAQAGQELVANDVSLEPRYLFLDVLPETRSEVTLPLRIGERVLGVLDVQSDQLNDFHETDMLVLRALAGNIAVAIENARLYSGMRRRAEQLAGIAEVSNAIVSVLDPELLLTEVVSLIHKRFGYPFVHLYTLNNAQQKLIYEAGSGERSQAMKEYGYTLDLEDPLGVVSWVARQGETLLVNDVDKEPLYRQPPLPPFETHSELAVPLLYREEVLGVLDVQSAQVNAFGEGDRFLFEALADNIAVAMHNASLYKSEHWRRQVADSLHEVAGLLSADAGLSQVLKAILTELVRNLPCDVASIWLLDEEAGGEAEGESALNGLPPLRLAAVHGPFASVLNLAEGLDLRSFIEYEQEESEESALGASYLIAALNSDKPVIHSPGMGKEPLGTALDFPSGYSAIAAPLRIGDHHLGVLMLIHQTESRYGTEATNMTATFSSYATVAIQNARLYEKAHEQAWVSTVLLQVAEATQTIINLTDLTATIARITPMLVGIKACAIYLLDEDEVFVPSASSGLTTDGQYEFDRHRFGSGDVPAFDNLLAERRPSVIQIEDIEAEDEKGPENTNILLKSIFTPDQEKTTLPGEDNSPHTVTPFQVLPPFKGWLIVMPLMGRIDLLGAFIVVYNPDPIGAILENSFNETLSIIQGVVQQTAVAVENAHLFKSQKEEAYVSVALLQVAQAVVSNNDLMDILGSVVRITPILVGVRRAAIFIWDEERRFFNLAQSYGIPRSIEGQSFSPGTFPLLERVFLEDSLIACPSTPVHSSGDILESWAGQGGNSLDETQQHLESEANLLMAIPLSVKGQVLGVFIIEEPDVAIPGGGTVEAINRRMRPRRMEITTGISQQAALAIQNDRFQRETVRRERLDREMQLAREIQRTFLPHQLPKLIGWELNVYWRPALEVAGDFYDFFELSGNRLGVVIADVADKGIPAALYMTLVRTLMRATVLQVDDPAEVLARVNDILVPDSQQGMFVTIFYGVLDLESGLFSYANAGHNLPFVFCRETETIIKLKKGEIALGVVENIRFNGHQLEIHPDDFLILYTDGITEAFSPAELMYGEEGLQDTINQSLTKSSILTAGELLIGIDESVQAFMGDAPPADDLTLLVLHRTNRF